MALATAPARPVTMSMRRFLRGGYREATDPVHLLVRDQIVGVFVPAGSEAVITSAPLPSAPATQPTGAAVSGSAAPTGGTTEAYRKYAASLKGR